MIDLSGLKKAAEEFLQNIEGYVTLCAENSVQMPGLTYEQYTERRENITAKGYALYFKKNQKFYKDYLYAIIGQYPSGAFVFESGRHEREKIDHETALYLMNFADQLKEKGCMALAAEMYRVVVYYANDCLKEERDDRHQTEKLKIIATGNFASTCSMVSMSYYAGITLLLVEDVLDSIDYLAIPDKEARKAYAFLLYHRANCENTNYTNPDYKDLRRTFEYIHAGESFYTDRANRERDPDFDWDNVFLPSLNYVKFSICASREAGIQKVPAEEKSGLYQFIDQTLNNLVARTVYDDLTNAEKPLPDELMKNGVIGAALLGWAQVSYELDKISRSEYMNLLKKMVAEILKTKKTLLEKSDSKNKESQEIHDLRNDINRVQILIVIGGIMGKYCGKFLPDQQAAFTAIADQIFSFLKTQPMEVLPFLAFSRNETMHLVKMSSGTAQIEKYAERLQDINVSIGTFAHSKAIGKMNETMVRYLLDNNHLDWLVGMCGIKDVDGVKGKENELLRWARITGECHDLGKKELMSTIEQHFSPIVNLEFYVIRKHIEGRYFDVDDFGKDKDLAACINYVATKHHEAFLGQGRRGYPEVGHGNEETMPYAKIRDITQICDVMNAVISRSSYTEKRVMENALHVIESGKEDISGTTEFNPQLVDMILNSKPLQDELNWCSTEYYREQEYAGYLRYVQKISE